MLEGHSLVYSVDSAQKTGRRVVELSQKLLGGIEPLENGFSQLVFSLHWMPFRKYPKNSLVIAKEKETQATSEGYLPEKSFALRTKEILLSLHSVRVDVRGDLARS